MKQNKSILGLIVLASVFQAAFTVIAVVIGMSTGHSLSLWASYTIFFLATALAVLCSSMMLRKSVTMRDAMLGLAIWKHSIIFWAMELIIAIIFIALGNRANGGIAIALMILPFIPYLIFVGSGFWAKDTVDAIQQKVKVKTTSLRLLQADAQLLADSCTDPEMKAVAEKLAANIRFSDPMSHDSLVPLEEEIAAKIRDAKNGLASGNTEHAISACRQAQALLNERNLKCKILK